MIIRSLKPQQPIRNFHQWLKFIKQSVTNVPLDQSKIERPLTINNEHLQKVIDAKAERN